VSTEQISDLDLELDFRFTYPIYRLYSSYLYPYLFLVHRMRMCGY